MLSTNPSGTAFIKVSAILILVLPLLSTFVTLINMSFTIFIMADIKL